MIHRLLHSYPVRFVFLVGALIAAAGIILTRRLLGFRLLPTRRLPN